MAAVSDRESGPESELVLSRRSSVRFEFQEHRSTNSDRHNAAAPVASRSSNELSRRSSVRFEFQEHRPTPGDRDRHNAAIPVASPSTSELSRRSSVRFEFQEVRPQPSKHLTLNLAGHALEPDRCSPVRRKSNKRGASRLGGSGFSFVDSDGAHFTRLKDWLRAGSIQQLAEGYPRDELLSEIRFYNLEDALVDRPEPYSTRW